MDWLLYKQGNTKEQSKSVYINFIDNRFLNTLDIQVAAGRLFSSQFPSDTSDRFILNEEGARQLGFSSPQDAIGKWVGFEPEGALPITLKWLVWLKIFILKICMKLLSRMVFY